MKEKANLLRRIPKVDDVLNKLAASENLQSPSNLVTEAVRKVLSEIREDILSGASLEVASMESILSLVKLKLTKMQKSKLHNVINATGIILHTNLGRARLGDKAVDAVVKAARNYSNLEYDVELGKRGNRNSHIEEILTRLTGAESAIIVNNNAAAVMLILSTVARGKEVVISRGELVEIGGSFRIPAIIEQSGSILNEVGTTNKTHLYDYQDAIDPETTAALLKVHTSNFKIAGFSDSPALKELADLSRKHSLPLIHDIGSGTLVDLNKYGIADEPTVHKSVEDGADIISFSGDKLLGGPQAGIIIGKKKYIDAMKKNQLARALRIDKLTLAALEATLRAYLEDTAEEDIPTLNMLSASKEKLKDKADKLGGVISDNVSECTVEVIEEYSQVGGGSVPGQMLDTFVVALQTEKISVMELESRIRKSDAPIIARISKNRLLLDVRTIEEHDFSYIASRIAQCLN